MTSHSIVKDTLAVLVLYNRRLDETETFQSLASWPDKSRERFDLLIYDNSPSPMLTEGAELSGFRIHYVHDKENPGVSKAYNIGARLGRQLGKTWLLLLDQDTTFPDDALIAYQRAIHEHPEAVLFAPILKASGKIYSPCRYYLKRGFHPRRVRPGRHTIRHWSVLNSGMCISLPVFEQIGGFDERVGLDFADHEFINRFRRFFDSFVVVDTVCAHGFYDVEQVSVEGSLRRFALFCEGAHASMREPADRILLPIQAALRAVKLSIRFRTGRFLKTFFSVFVPSKSTTHEPPL
ncbi:MAG: glycosyltransferase [candidate division WOR-3 bacterium]